MRCLRSHRGGDHLRMSTLGMSTLGNVASPGGLDGEPGDVDRASGGRRSSDDGTGHRDGRPRRRILTTTTLPSEIQVAPSFPCFASSSRPDHPNSSPCCQRCFALVPALLCCQRCTRSGSGVELPMITSSSLVTGTLYRYNWLRER